ncbi:MAG: PEGA domain-containing protein [Methanolinea sp.]|nr:PEGA domain-containing protein [Methanolinea sp.]
MAIQNARSLTFFLVLVLFLALCITQAAAQIGGGTGYFEITSFPSGASVYFDGTYQGTTPVTVPVSVTGTPTHTIRVTKSGYMEWTQTYDGNPFEGETIHISATLQPVPGGDKGYYSIYSSPSGASVYFDGSYKGTTPLTVTVSTTGTPGHTIRLVLSGYQEWSSYQPGNPGEGETLYVTATLQPVQTYGSITVTSSPSGATAILDGAQTQSTPCTFNNVLPGTHTIQVSKSGYQLWSTTTTVSAGLNTQVYASLSPIQPATGSIYVSSVPTGASVYVDGTYYGPAPQLASGLSPGYHQVRISLSGFQDWIGSVLVESGATTRVTQTLSVGPTPTPVPGTGSVSIHSTPAGADVYLDNVYMGITPLTLPSVTPGTHTVLLTLQGYSNWEATIAVQRDLQTPVEATLSASPTPLPTKAGLSGPLAVLGIGILALFFLGRRR